MLRVCCKTLIRNRLILGITGLILDDQLLRVEENGKRREKRKDKPSN